MSRLYGNQDGEPKADGGDRKKKLHQKPGFLVTTGWGQEWVHCPACMAKNDGWSSDGEPRYEGGFIRVAIPRKDGQMHESVTACRCEIGKRYHESPRWRLRYFDQCPPGTVFMSRPAAILWTKGQTGRPPEPKAIAGGDEYVARSAEQFKRHMAKEITFEQYQENVEVLAVKLMPPRVTAPRMEDLLRSNLGHLYFPHLKVGVNERAEGEAPSPSGWGRSAYKED